MKTAAIIAEYNPFHTGHEYQINYIKEKLRTDYVVIAMSGDFVQRGTPALFSKNCTSKNTLFFHILTLKSLKYKAGWRIMRISY